MAAADGSQEPAAQPGPGSASQTSASQTRANQTSASQTSASQTSGSQARAEAVADRIAADLARMTGLARFGAPARQRAYDVLHQLGDIDRAVYAAVAGVPAPALDAAMRRLSGAADHSKLWLSIAGVLALTGPAGRRSAARGVLAIGATSALVNIGVKALSGRRRPDRSGAGVPGARHVPMPSSTSFPSGHSAAAFAFATAISRDSPWLAVAIQFMAGSVAYSRVHTGVHYPGDTIAGALIGAGTGQAVSSLADRALSPGRVPPRR